MRVRCWGTADYRCNAVGSLELDSRAEGLSITLRGVSSYREGYAPGPPVHASAVNVPWASVYATCIGDESLLLSVDSRYLPLNRLLIAQFTDAPPDDAPARSSLRRLPVLLIVGITGALGAGVLALGLAGALPHPRAFGTLGQAAALAAVTMAVLAALGHHEPRRPSAEVLRDFSRELSSHLSNHVAVEPPAPPPRSLVPLDLSAFLPRSALAVAITLAAATLAALIGSSAARPNADLTSERGAGLRGEAASAAISLQTSPLQTSPLQTNPAPAPPNRASSALDPVPLDSTSARGSTGALDSTGAPGAAGALDSTAPLSRPQFGAACECARDTERLGSEPLPRLTPVVLRRTSRQHEGHWHTELELAVVNDGGRDAAPIALSVLFYEERAGVAGQWQTSERPLHFQGHLGPGQLIQWHVEGRGTSFDIVGPDSDTLAADGSDAAPAQAFVTLARDGAPALGWHAARLLAFIGDERARPTALALRPSASPGALRYLERMAMAARDVVACRVSVARAPAQRWHLDACLYNRTRESRRDLGLRLLALDGGLASSKAGHELPEVLAEHTAALDVVLAPESGRAVALSMSLPVESGLMPRMFDVVVDREENLP